MARYDDNNRDRWRDDDRERSNWRSDTQGTSQREDERGFFERAGEEIRSWFSDDDDNGGQRGQSWDRDREMNRGPSRGSEQYRSGSSWDRDHNQRHVRSSMDYGDRSSFGGISQGGYGRSGGSDRGQGGSYGQYRGGERGSMSNRDRSGFSEDRGYRTQNSSRGHAQSWGEANRGQSGPSNRDRDQDDGSYGYRSDMSGSLGGFGNQTSFGSGQDDHYRSWRDRQLAELDRDYDDYCREREQKFHSDFDSWRQGRSSRSPSAATNASGTDLGTASNAGVGTTTASVTGSAGAGSAPASATGTGGSIQADTTGSTETVGEGTGSGAGRSGSRTRS
jgi:hypothetical protein